jgi:hypothetical protein
MRMRVECAQQRVREQDDTDLRPRGRAGAGAQILGFWTKLDVQSRTADSLWQDFLTERSSPRPDLVLHGFRTTVAEVPLHIGNWKNWNQVSTGNRNGLTP